MKITFVISNANLSGGVRAISIYAEKLKSFGHHVTVVSRPRPAPTIAASLRSLLRGRGWPGKPNRKTHFDAATIDHRVIDRWRPMTNADVPDGDVVIATWWETAEWVSRLSPAKGAKVYFVQHHEVVFGNQPVQRIEATYRLPMRKVCCARWLKDLMAERYGDPTATYVPYGVDHALFDAPPRGKQSAPTVGVMYSKAHFKGCDISLKAFNLAAQRIPGLKLRAFGAVAADAELPLPPGTEYHRQPPQSKIREIYSSCDAWLFASRCEGFGMPLQEAMACRTPVIATPTGFGPEAVEDGGGILVNHEDPPAMADAIVRICSMAEPAWRATSDAAYATAAGYDWDIAARQFEASLLDAAQARHVSETAA